MSAWRELVSAAVVGTERRPVPPAPEVAAVLGGEPPSGGSGGPSMDDAEARLLVAAGVLAAWRRAGAVTAPGSGPPPEPAAEDERPTPSPRAVQLLELLLDGQATPRGTSTDLLADWLTRCDASGHRLPAGTLPRALEAATAAASLRVPAVAAGGPRLRWLAAHRTAWAWAAEAAGTGADPEEVWAEGTREQRVAVLASLRERDPARARSLLAGTWGTESGADRARFVEVFATGLSHGDEPFLEAALDDRAKSVRRAAATLLASLPDSRLAGRMTDRLRPLVRVETRAGGIARATRPQLRVAVPGTVSPAAVRDGIVPDGAPPGVGYDAWALIQLIGAAPLRFWEEALEAPPEEIVALGADRPEVLAGWLRAASRQRDPAWARPLLRQRPDPALVAALPPEVVHDELARILGHADDASVMRLLAAVPAPWPQAVSHAVVDRLRAVRRRSTVRSVLSVLATALDPAAAPEVEDWEGTLPADDPVRGALRELTKTLSLRQAIADELG